MSPPRVLLVELESLLAIPLSQRLGALGVELAEATSVDAVERLLTAPPDLAIINLELSHGSGFGLVNRLRRMEALAGIKLALVADDATPSAIEAHREGPTPADAYLSRVKDSSTAAFSEVVLQAAQRLLGDDLPDAEEGDLVQLAPGVARPEDDLAEIIAELGGYRVLRRLQDEDGGAVFACMDEELRRPVAIKVMGPGEAGEEERLQRFERERRILALLHSPYVVAVYGAGTHRGMPYLVRELIDGEDLERKIRRDGPLDIATALQLARETARGLKHAIDAGVIHRGVCPSNIHVVEGHAKLARFGMGKRQSSEEQRITREGLQLTDFTYIAPERARGQEDERGDIYALGVTLHTLIAGAPPFLKPASIDLETGRLQGPPLSLEGARAGTPPKVSALVARLMAEDPEQRPQSYDAVLALLDEALHVVSGGGDAALQDLQEPTAVHGTLRLMSVTEIAQGLELAKKTATVFLQLKDAPEGKLAVEEGRLVHASFGAEEGEAAFFTLLDFRQGAFRVEYEPLSLVRNIRVPIAGLLLEAARRKDEGRPGEPVAPLAPEPPLEDAAVHAPEDPGEEDDEEGLRRGGVRCLSCGSVIAYNARTCLYCAAPTRAPRQVSTAWGFALVALVTTAAVFAGLHLPWGIPAEHDDDEHMTALASLLAERREQLAQARYELASVEPRLVAFEAERASVEELEVAAREKTADLHAALEAALKPELSARQLRLRLSEEGTEAIIEIGEAALFNRGGDEIQESGKSALARLTGAIASLSDVRLRVEGHTDNTEPGSRSPHQNNWGLSGARALAVARVLIEQGLPKQRVTAVALADSAPVVSNAGPRGRARNRRIELRLIPEPRLPGDAQN